MSSGNLPLSNGHSKKPLAQLVNKLKRKSDGNDDSSDSEEKEEENCICGRSRHRIKCVNCLNVFVGRLRLVCPAHPGVYFLMDIFNCSKCGASREYLVYN